jgi:hypothetical protein
MILSIMIIRIMILSIMILSIMISSTMILSMTQRINDSQHKDTQYNCGLSVIILIVIVIMP